MATRVEPVRGRLARLRLPHIAVRTRYLLAGLIVVQWAAVAAFAVTVRHNRWLWYQGGDQLWHYTGAWLLAHGHLPPAYVGYGWSFLLAPIALLTGPDLLPALPPIVLLDLLVLLPVALLAVYGIAERIAGRAFGFFAAALWIAVPYLGIRMALEGYHMKYTEVTLPPALGLTALADFPGMVAMLVSAYLCLRATERRPVLHAAAAGLAAGWALAIKPSNALFLVAPALLFLGYRLVAIPAFAAGLAPSLLTLVVWKERGLGHVPAFSTEPARRVASGTGTADVLHPVRKYFDLDWHQLNNNRLGLKEHFWSERLIDWLVIAGLLALLRTSRRGFLLVAPWFVAFLVVKGTYAGSTVESGSFFRLLMPAFPAFLLLIASIPLLFPGLRRRPPLPRPDMLPHRARIALVGVAAAFSIAPLGVVAAASPLRRPAPPALLFNGILVPVARELDLRATQNAGEVRLAWRRESTRAAGLFYFVFRTRAPDGGVSCTQRGSGSAQCTVVMDGRGARRTTRFADRPPPGRWTYRVGIGADWLDDPRFADIYVLSEPVTVTVG